MTKDVREWHPSRGWLTQAEFDAMTAAKNGGGDKSKRKALEKTAEKEAKEMPFPPVKFAVMVAAMLAITSPASADNSGKVVVCPAGTFRAVEVTGYDGTTASVEVYCAALPVTQPEQHPTLVKNAPPIDQKIMDMDEE